MKQIKSICFVISKWMLLLFFVQILFSGCVEEDVSVRISRVNDRTAEHFVKKLSSDKRFQEITRIAVLPILNDNSGLMRSALNKNLLDNTDCKVSAVVGQKEMDTIIKDHSFTMKYQDMYNKNSTNLLGKLIKNRHAINGKIISLKLGKRNVRIEFRGQVIDLQEGLILFEGSARGRYSPNPNNLELIITIAISAVLLALVFFVSRGNIFVFSSENKMILWIGTLSIWILILFIYYMCPI